MENSAIILIDFINDIIHQDGKIPSCAKMVESMDIINKVNKVISFGRKKNLPIIFVIVGFTHNYTQLPLKSPIFGQAQEIGALEIGSWGTEVHEKIHKQSFDPVVIKHRISPFYGTNLELTLKSKNINNLIIAGVSTEWAIQAVIRDAHDRDYNTFLIEDCCASHSEESHKNSINTLSRITKIIKSEEIENLIK